VNRGLWDYVNDPILARDYDERLVGTPLLELDLRFAEHHFDRPGRLLDLGCGTGRLMIPFAQRGFQVLGVDLSEEMLRIVGEKAAAAGVVVDRLKANIVDLDGLADSCFDYAACLFSTLGMVSGDGERRRVVRHVRRLLRPGGTFVLHVHNYWFNLWDRQGRRWLIRDWFRAKGGDRPMPVHQGVAGLALHHFTRREALQLLAAAGFQIREVRPITLHSKAELPRPPLFAAIHAYGYLIAARSPR
jgi:SAM-dependent methyltransferase